MTKSINLTEAEEKLANLIWRKAPLSSPDLVSFAGREYGWKKSTTYTILKKLCDKGVFSNINANITVLLSCEDLLALQSRTFVEDSFGGSLPRFITTFIGDEKLTAKQAEELRRLIENHDESNTDG